MTAIARSRRRPSAGHSPLPTPAPRAVGYIRVSTEEQGRSGLGLEAQESSIRAACAAHGWPPVSLFQDVDSGGKDARQGLQEALRSLRPGNLLLIKEQSRLGKRFASLALLEELEDRGVQVYVTATCRFADTSLLTAVEGGMAVEERRKIRERTRAALAAKKARGGWVGAVPFGFRVSACRRLEPDPATTALRNRALRLRCQGRSLRVIAELVGLPKSTVHRALRDHLRSRKARYVA